MFVLFFTPRTDGKSRDSGNINEEKNSTGNGESNTAFEKVNTIA